MEIVEKLTQSDDVACLPEKKTRIQPSQVHGEPGVYTFVVQLWRTRCRGVGSCSVILRDCVQ